MKMHHMLGAMVVLVAAGNSVHAAELSQWQKCKDIGSLVLGCYVGGLGGLAIAEGLLDVKYPWHREACKDLGLVLGSYIGWRLSRMSLEESNDIVLQNKSIESYLKAFALGSITAELANDKIFHVEDPWVKALLVVGCAYLCGRIAMDATYKAELEKLKARGVAADFEKRMLLLLQDENAWTLDDLKKYYQHSNAPLHAMLCHFTGLRTALTKQYENVCACAETVITIDGTFYKTQELRTILKKRLDGLKSEAKILGACSRAG